MTQTKYLTPWSDSDPPAKRSIMVTALGLFAKRGVDGVTIRDIAKLSGYSNPAMFRHFKTKEELAFYLFKASYLHLRDRFARTDNQISEAISDCLDLIESSPESVHFVLENMRRFWHDLPSDVRQHSLLGLMRRMIVAEQAAGRIRADIDHEMASALILGFLGQIARLAQFGELHTKPSQLHGQVMALVMHGIKTNKA